MKNENNDMSLEKTNKDNERKNYIIVGILYVIVIILSVLLVLGLRNQKEVVKDNFTEQSKTESKVEENNTFDKNASLKDNQTGVEENTNSNNFFEDISSFVDDVNTEKNTELNEGLNMFEQTR